MRPPSRIRTTFAAAAAALALLTAACSSEPDPRPSAPVSSTTEAPAATGQPSSTVTAATTTAATTQPAAPETTAVAQEATDDAPAAAAPTLAVDPVKVSSGINTFAVSGTGFDPDLAVWLLICALPGDSLSVDTPAQQVAAAMELVSVPGDCVLFADVIVDIDPDGHFTAALDVDVQANFMWYAGDQAGTQAATAAVFLEDTEPPEMAPATTAPPEPAPTTTEPASAATEPAPAATEPAPVTTEPAPVTTEPAPVTTEPAPVTTEPAPVTTEPAPTTTEPPEPAVAAVSAPLERCAAPGSPGATRVSVLAGTTAEGFYEPVVQGGEDSCERIKAWWDQIRQAEAERIAEGQYPCEYTAAYNYWPHLEKQTNGPAILAGCWPRRVDSGPYKGPDPAAETYRLWFMEGYSITPPNHPALVEALYDCYRDALQGPPPGWSPPEGGEWVAVQLCPAMLDAYGIAVRDLGVAPQCAAQQMRGKVAERKQRGYVRQTLGEASIYGGDFSWANCPTSASRLLAEGSSTYSERCDAVVDATATPDADIDAEVVTVVKAMFCGDTKQALRDLAADYQPFVPQWTQSYGDFVWFWTPLEGSLCYEAGMLVAAQKAVTSEWTRVINC